MKVKIHTLREFISSGSTRYPVFIGFATAADLLTIAEAPAFTKTTNHHVIATNVLTPPVIQWQRPLIDTKIDEIMATFSDHGEFMPNPVLVAERGEGADSGIELPEQLKASDGVLTEVFVVEIPVPAEGQPRPLWIIDGQHRIKGLGDAKCLQNSNMVPVVLLLNVSTKKVYNGGVLAKLFAQVTTESTPLQPLHKHWLTYAFKLSPFNADRDLAMAMETVATLCKTPLNSITSKSNNFYDDIAFNDAKATSSRFLGKQYQCDDLSGIIAKWYYRKASLLGYLTPAELAMQIDIAFDELVGQVPAPHDKSVFFGKNNYCHKIMIDAFMIGVLTYLLKQKKTPTTKDWHSLLNTLAFSQTDWNFEQHVKTKTRWTDKSGALAECVFEDAFGTAQLPPNVNTLWDFLNGDQLRIKLQFRYVGKKNHSKVDSSEIEIGIGTRRTIPMNGRKWFRVLPNAAGRSLNAMHLEIVDGKSSPSAPRVFKDTGEYLRPPKVSKLDPSQTPLHLEIKCFLYGGNEQIIHCSLAGWEQTKPPAPPKPKKASKP